MRAIDALLFGLVDYAGLFPPAAEDMRRALENYASYLKGPDRFALGRFIVPLSRLPELEEAARISGGSWLQCYRRVLIPLLTPTFIVVGLLGFISAARDISTVVLLGSSQSRTMALLALDYAFGGQFERGAVVAFLTSLVVIVIALIAHVVGSKVGIGGQH